MKVLVATRSAHKLGEIRRILGEVPGLELVDPGAVGIPPSVDEEEIESFETFEENAVAKARYFHRLSGLPALADDSGLEVDALGGAPGVRSKRFAPDAPEEGDARDRTNNLHLLALLGDTPLARRKARYVCAAALVSGEGAPVVVRGEVEGLILGIPRGRGGFGYDPLFYHQESGCTFGELSPAAKHQLSHRGQAFRLMASPLSSLAGTGGEGC